MDRRFAGVLLLGLAALPRLLAQNNAQVPAQNQAQTQPAAQNSAAAQPQAPAQAQPSSDRLVFEIPGDQWFEGALQRVTISPDGTFALVQRGAGAPGHRDVRLISLKTGKDDHFTLIYDLNRIDNAVFYGRSSLARLGERASEHGWFITSGESEQLTSLPVDAVPAFGTSSREIAYYRTEAPSQAVFVTSGDQFRDFGVSGRILSMAFSPDGNYFYDLLLEPSGESYLDRINVNTGESRVLARHLDAAPQPGRIALSADGHKIYLALAGDSAPSNEERHEPEADDRWLKIYELDLASGAKRALVSSPGADNSAPVVVGNYLYWIRTVFNQWVVVLPAAGGKPKETVSGGMVPMWSPDSHRIGFSYGSPRLADWGLNLDDAVVALDDQANVASQPAVIVSGYHEDFPPAWSPDGAWIAFHSHRSPKAVPLFDDAASTDDIYLRHADDIHAPEIRLTDFGLDAGPAYWSPDGKRLLFTSQDRNGPPGVDKLYLLTLGLELGRALKAQLVPLPATIHNVDWAAWSPDGVNIAVEDSRGDDDRSLWTVHTDGSHAEKLIDYKCSTFCGVDWASDGKTIVYSAMLDGHAQIFAVPYFGGAARQLTQDSANLFHPQISPDGKWIACTRVVESKQIWRRPLQ